MRQAPLRDADVLVYSLDVAIDSEQALNRRNFQLGSSPHVRLTCVMQSFCNCVRGLALSCEAYFGFQVRCSPLLARIVSTPPKLLS